MLQGFAGQLLRMGDPFFHQVQHDGDEADHASVVVPGLVTAEVVHHVVRVPAGWPEGLRPDRGQALVLTAPLNPLGRLRAALCAAHEPWLIRAGGAGLVNHSPGVVETRIGAWKPAVTAPKPAG